MPIPDYTLVYAVSTDLVTTKFDVQTDVQTDLQ
jgi:hypothetical protein